MKKIFGDRARFNNFIDFSREESANP